MPGEIQRSVARFGLPSLLDTEGTAYIDAGLKYLKMSDAELLLRIEQEPKLLVLPLVRAANKLSKRHDEESLLSGSASYRRSRDRTRRTNRAAPPPRIAG